MNQQDQSRRNFLKVMTAAGATLALANTAKAQPAAEGKNVALLKTPPMEKIRVGFIGVGARGSGHVGSMLKLEGVEVTAICDTHEPSRKASVARCVKEGRKEPAGYGEKGELHYQEMLKRDDIDMVIIATPWEWHTRMCVDAMNAGKHAFTEVPAAITEDECWQLVNTAEKTQKHCMMLENCCYGREELFCLNLIAQGMLGELLHGEGGYLHDLRGQMREVEHGTGSWRTYHYIKRNGNMYPTHGLGPIAQYMNVNRGDKFDYMSSVSSPAVARAEYAKKNFPPDHKWNQVKEWKGGDQNTSIIKTALGRSIIVQFNESDPRPYSRINLIRGSKGIFMGYPSRLMIEGVTPKGDSWLQDNEKEAKLEEFMKKYEHPLWAKMGEMAKKNGGHGGMDFIMLWRIVTCLRAGEPLDQSVYDAAAWSAVGPLSEKSVAAKSCNVDFADYTRGAWRTTPPLGIIS